MEGLVGLVNGTGSSQVNSMAYTMREDLPNVSWWVTIMYGVAISNSQVSKGEQQSEPEWCHSCNCCI